MAQVKKRKRNAIVINDIVKLKIKFDAVLVGE
jgi:hypothetical protein